MRTAFLFLDECTYSPLDLAALTGILVSDDRYAALRDALCRLAVDVQPSPPGMIPAAVEFHARDLLSELAPLHGDRIDSVRLSVFQRAVDLLAEHELAVWRVTYLNRKEIASMMPLDPKLYGIMFLGLVRWLQGTMANTLVIPVMDGVPATGGMSLPHRAPRVDPILIRAFAATVRSTHHFRQYPTLADNLSIANARNLGEPVFADSAHSVLLQFVDIVSHMLLQCDRAEVEGEATLSSFRRDALAIARTMPQHLLHLWKGKMHTGTAGTAEQEAGA